jgi:IS5 family transposase
VVYRDRRYFEAKSKGYDSTIEREVKEKPLGIKDIFRDKRISSRRAPSKRVYAATKQMYKEGKVLVTTVQRANLRCCVQLFVLISINLGH